MVVDIVEVPANTAADEPEILAEVRLEFREIQEQTEGVCSCVCINDEQSNSCSVQ